MSILPNAESETAALDEEAGYGDDHDNEPYCVCDLEPIEEEMCSMTCFCCGKEICP